MDFVRTIKDWRRMCEKNRADCMRFCPICANPACGELTEASDEDIRKAEDAVMAWAKEHPEPVYPTWEKYLVDLMTLDMIRDKTDNPNSVENYMRKTPIPPDIAQKLGIEPKEG